MEIEKPLKNAALIQARSRKTLGLNTPAATFGKTPSESKITKGNEQTTIEPDSINKKSSDLD